MPTDAFGVSWPARLRFGTRTLLLGLTGVAAAAPLTTRGLAFNAIALTLTALALLLQPGLGRLANGINAQHRIAGAYLVIGLTILSLPHRSDLCAYVTGAALLAVALLRWHMSPDRRQPGLIGVGSLSAGLGVSAIIGGHIEAPWLLGFVIAGELVAAGLWALLLGFGQRAHLREAPPANQGQAD